MLKRRSTPNIYSLQIIVFLCVCCIILVIDIVHQDRELKKDIAYAEYLEKAVVSLQEEIAEKEKEINEMKLAQEVSRGAQVKGLHLTAAELDYVARTIAAEAGNQPIEGQIALAQCIHDRLKNGNYGASATAVIDAAGQFSTPYAGDMAAFPGATYAAYSVFVLGELPYDAEVLVFFNPETANKDAAARLRHYALIAIIGNHEFRGNL